MLHRNLVFTCYVFQDCHGISFILNLLARISKITCHFNTSYFHFMEFLHSLIYPFLVFLRMDTAAVEVPGNLVPLLPIFQTQQSVFSIPEHICHNLIFNSDFLFIIWIPCIFCQCKICTFWHFCYDFVFCVCETEHNLVCMTELSVLLWPCHVFLLSRDGRAITLRLFMKFQIATFKMCSNQEVWEAESPSRLPGKQNHSEF